MHPIILELGRLKIYSFGSFIALGALAAGLVIYYLATKRQLPRDRIFDLTLYTLLAGLVGARIGYYFLYRNQFQSLFQVFFIWQGGLVALIGVIIGLGVYLYLLRRHPQPVWPMLDIGMLGWLAGWIIGKIGCHLSLCSVGRPYSGFLNLAGGYPVDLFSAIWAVILLGILFYLWQKNRLSEGIIFFLALEGFFLGELLIKTLKADFGVGVGRLETTSYLILIILCYMIFWRYHGPKVKLQPNPLRLKRFLGRKKLN